ncbi:NADP-dependent oxidoreductase [Agromyces sp. MMS24-JH15]|uniref:NADP-dependent oxidoreductase n=1 Tax=Agromyces sp. MMS24-JH15 TaxID=3243765 RepID=UPI00374A0AC3
MKAYVLHSPGEAPRFTEVDIPEPAPGEVRVRVTAASVNGFDLAVAAGMMAPFFEYRYPVVLGREFAGVVDAVGPDADGLAPGDRVIGVVAKPHLSEGAFAEYTTAPVDSAVVHAPASVDDVVAASLAHGGSTAVACLEPIDLEGATVLIVGATGGVGTLAVQLAEAAGARVIATARTPEGAELLESLGADAVVAYPDGLGDAVRALAPDGVDAAIHLAGDPAEISPVVRDGGLFVSPLLYSPEQFADDRLTFVPIAAAPTREMLASLVALVDEGSLQIIVDRSFAFDELEDAHAAWGRNTLGNLVVIAPA